MAVARKITALVTPASGKSLDLATVATAMAADTGIDTAVVVPGAAGGAVDTGIRHILVTTDKENLASTCKTNLDASIAAENMVLLASSPQLESNDADNAVSISRAAGATTVRFTATDIDQAPDNSIAFSINTGGILASSITQTPVSDGVIDVAIDLAAGDNAGPYTVVVTATDRSGLSSTCDLVVTSTA